MAQAEFFLIMGKEDRFGVAALDLDAAVFAEGAVAQAFFEKVAIDRLGGGSAVAGSDDHLAVRRSDATGGV